ncbi:MAG: hypothetical protein AAB486_02735 [Patescibacteria group bacterium]
MSGIRQSQPGAITDLMSCAQIITGQLQPDSLFFTVRGEQLHFLGISQGVGTCARGRTVPVAVFGLDQPNTFRAGRDVLPGCAFVVLARGLTPTETEQGRQRFGTPCLEAVELLRFVEPFSRGIRIVFQPTGIVNIFVVTI